MLDLGRPNFLNALGRSISRLPRTNVFVLSIVGLLAFVLVSTPIVKKASLVLAKSYGVKGAVAQAPDPGQRPAGPSAKPFVDRHMDATGAAYNAFFNLGLSKENFISHYTEPHQEQGNRFEYIYWELWVKKDFDFAGALDLLNRLVANRVRGLALKPVQVDTKTYQIDLVIDGIETHKLIFSKTGVEAEDDAAALALVDIARRVPREQYRGPARLAIIIDDIGYRQEVERQFLSLPAKLAFAVLPYSPEGVQFANEAHRLGHEVMLHLPMEPKAYPEISPGKGGLLLQMSEEEILQSLDQSLRRIPHITGVNNHMGSAFTSDERKMTLVLSRIGQEGLFFIDSRTAGSAIGYEVAKNLGIPTAARNIFLDHDPRPELIAQQFDTLVQVALRKGTAVAIGHPHTATLQTLRQKLPELRTLNIVVVSPSQIVQ